MSWEMWPEADLKHFRHQKNRFGAIESQFGVQKGQFQRAMSLIWQFEVYSGWKTNLMDHFSGLCHGNVARGGFEAF